MSLVLRHKPEQLGLELDQHGWIEVSELLAAMRSHGMDVDLALLDQVVSENDNQRFTFNEDKSRIRANQGHSVEVDVELKEVCPPDVLYHGTVEKVLDSVRESGLQKMSRQHVHLSIDIETAAKVGSRRGKPVILKVSAGQMSKDGHTFFLSKNGVWLTEHVPHEYVEFP